MHDRTPWSTSASITWVDWFHSFQFCSSKRYLLLQVVAMSKDICLIPNFFLNQQFYHILKSYDTDNSLVNNDNNKNKYSETRRVQKLAKIFHDGEQPPENQSPNWRLQFFNTPRLRTLQTFKITLTCWASEYICLLLKNIRIAEFQEENMSQVFICGNGFEHQK